MAVWYAENLPFGEAGTRSVTDEGVPLSGGERAKKDSEEIRMEVITQNPDFVICVKPVGVDAEKGMPQLCATGFCGPGRKAWSGSGWRLVGAIRFVFSLPPGGIR